MRLFHVSEEPGIARFEPRKPLRKDLDPDVGLIWALDEAHLPNFLTPRDCPRIGCRAGRETTDADRNRFFSAAGTEHLLVIEGAWLDRLRNTSLYLYEFDPGDFVLQDAVAGYYVATKTQRPMAVHRVDDLLGELIARGVEVRIVRNLWAMADVVRTSTLHWSLCRMAHAQPRP